MDLKEMRERKRSLGLTNEMLADISGVPLATVQKVIGGTTKSPRRETLAALEETLTVGGRADQFLRIALNESNKVSESQAAYSAVKNNKSATVISSKKQGEYTIEDYLNWPEDIRVELINGRIYFLSAPTNVHQVFAGEIFYQIKDYIRKKGGKCIPFISPVDVQLDEDDKTMVQPDVLIVCGSEKYNTKRVVGAPDFVLEVMSRSSKSRDCITKTEKYLNAGCREYWIVDPEREQVIVYDFENENYPIIHTLDDKVPVNIYNGDLKIDFAIIKKEMINFFGGDWAADLGG